jgi:hypothetical protein
MDCREILEEVRTGVPVRHYNLECSVNGDVPGWLAEKFPLFGSEDGDETYLNSGGRSILIESGGEAYRIKGVDPKGVITRTVSDSGKNLVFDTAVYATNLPDPDYAEAKLKLGEFRAFPRKGKPFNFLTRRNAERSKAAFDVMNEEYGKRGFSHPCAHIGSIEYPGITWGEEPVYSVIFRLNRIESDLREEEFTWILNRHLNHASTGQLYDISEEFAGFYRKLLMWHAFECGIMADHGLVPAGISMTGQNHAISYVTDDGMGLVRVDHSLTKRLGLKENEMDSRITQFQCVLGKIPSVIKQALEMSRAGVKYDREKHSNYYNAAFGLQSFGPETEKFIASLFGEFRKSYDGRETPEPIGESELLNLYDEITSIEMDMDI